MLYVRLKQKYTHSKSDYICINLNILHTFVHVEHAIRQSQKQTTEPSPIRMYLLCVCLSVSVCVCCSPKNHQHQSSRRHHRHCRKHNASQHKRLSSTYRIYLYLHICNSPVRSMLNGQYICSHIRCTRVATRVDDDDDDDDGMCTYKYTHTQIQTWYRE